MHGCACVCVVESFSDGSEQWHFCRGRANLLECWRENIALHHISSVLGFCPFCSMVRLYWQEELEVKTVLFILLLS